MKKVLALIVAVIIIAGVAFGVYRFFFASSSYSSVDVNIGAVDDSAAAELCRDKKAHEHLVCLAGELKKTLSSDALASVQLDYSLTNAQRWSNFPPMGYRNRVGITLDKLDRNQLAIVKQILKQATSATPGEGYDEIEQIFNADDYLYAKTKENGFSSGNFHFAFLGTPAATGTWELQFGGHHLALANTYRDGKLVGATPSFRGVEPFGQFDQNGRQNNPIQSEQQAFATLLKALSNEETAKAKLSQTFSDVLVGPQKDDTFPVNHSGIRVGDLTPEKQALVIKAIETYVDDVFDEGAGMIMQHYTSQLADTYLSFTGTPDVNQVNDYVRIDGPSVWIELSMQRGASLPGAHPHSVWRDKQTDYGGNK